MADCAERNIFRSTASARQTGIHGVSTRGALRDTARPFSVACRFFSETRAVSQSSGNYRCAGKQRSQAGVPVDRLQERSR